MTPLLPEQAKGLDRPVIVECEPILEAWVTGNHTSEPYIGCYMATDYLGGNQTEGSASAVRVTVSFRGSNQSVIQSDNWLMAGIAAQGPDSVYGGCNAIDWGYTFGLWVAPYLPQPHFYAQVFEGHEWVNCLPGYVKSICSWTSTVPNITINSNVTLIMQWTEETLDYSVEVDGVYWPLYSYTPNETALHYFMTGTVGRSWGGLPLPNTVKFLQFFGAWSNYNIGDIGWHSYLSHPGYIAGEASWTDVSFAYSTDGLNSYWDNTLGWGGATYDNVNANYSYQHVHFYPSSDGTTLEPDTLLWSPPLCAMKTKADGYFYKPNVATGVLKIEMLFDNQNCTGGQTGGTSPYDTIANYPDTIVDIFDSTFISSHVGEGEGDSNWNYMADINPDRYIDIFDAIWMAWNSGKIGTYITDLSGVTVLFNTGEEISPDSSGFVAIPQNAASFTVKRNGNPIGAMIIFW